MEVGWMLFLICGSIAVANSNQMLVSSLNILGFVVPFAVLTVVTPMLGLCLAWLLCGALGAQSEYWLSGLLLGQMFVTIPVLVVFRQLWKSREEPPTEASGVTPEMVRRLFVFAWPISIAVVLSWSQNQGYRFIMEDMVGLHDLGMFVAAYGIAMGIMSAVESLLGSTLQPRFYLRLHTPGISPAEAWNEYASVALPVLALTAATLAVASKEAVHVFLSPTYWGTANFLCWAAAIEFTRTAANTYSLCMHAEMNTRRLIVPSLLGAVLSIGFMTVAARQWGLNGIGPALAMAGLLNLVTWHLAAHRLSGVAVPIRGLTLACAGGLLALGVVSAVHVSTAGSGTALSLVLAVIAVSAIYLSVAALIVWPAIPESRRLPQLHDSP
jgi:O-antigen/teichoic acid export membrane protein